MRRAFGGAFFLALCVLTLSAQTIAVTKPAAGDTWTRGQSYTITWTKSGTMPANVRITLRNAASLAEVAVIADPAPNSGSHLWTIPAATADGSYKVRVKAKGANIESDSGAFTIAAAAPPPAGSITVAKPAAGDKWHRGKAYAIAWSRTGTMPNLVKISLMDKNSAAVVREIADNVPNSGTYSWNILGDVPFGEYRVRVLVKTTNIQDDSDRFSIASLPLRPGATTQSDQGGSIVSLPLLTGAKEHIIKGQYQNWYGLRPGFANSALQPPQSATSGYLVGYPPNTDPSRYAHVGYDYHSFIWNTGNVGATGWVAVCVRSRVYFLIDPFKSQAAKLTSAKMHLTQVSVQRLNDGNTSCAGHYFILTAPWTNWESPPTTTAGIPGSNGLEAGSADYYVDITSIVKSWLTGTTANYGLLLTSQEVDLGQLPKICGSAFDIALILNFKGD
jgi:hypothetical protein